MLKGASEGSPGEIAAIEKMSYWERLWLGIGTDAKGTNCDRDWKGCGVRPSE